MRILLWGLGAPTGVLLLQIVLWRIGRPRRDVLVLAAMLCAAGAIFAVLCMLPGAVSALRLPEGIFAATYALVLAGAVSVLYLITYAGLEAKSPSTLMVLAAEVSAPHGVSVEGLSALFSDEEFIVDRVHGLVRAGQVREVDGMFTLTLHGRLFLEAFMLPRRIMGLSHWGG